MKRAIAALLVALAAALPAQEPAPAVVRGAAHSEKVLPTRIDVDLRTLPKPKEWQPGDPIREVPRRRTRPAAEMPEPEPRLDPLLLRQSQAPVRASARAFTAPGVNVGAQGYTGVNPPDTVGDVSPAHYIQAINGSSATYYTIYNKTNGAVIAGPFTLAALGGSGACATGGGDPIVLYDELAQRWLITEFASSGNNLCIYVSQTSDPVSGGWYHYIFTLSEFPDYPKYAIWPDAYYLGANESAPAVYALDRSNMLAGAAATYQRFTTTALNAFSFQMLTPADLDGATPPPAGSPGIFMRHRDDEAHNAGANNAAQDYLELFTFHVDWATPANSTLSGPVTIPVSEFDSHLCGYTAYQCIPQQGSATTLDPLREVIMHRLPYRNFGDHEALVGCFATDVDGTDHAGVRWFELRRTGGGAWTLYQEGTYAPDAHNRWMPAIAMDRSGNIALGYNIASSTLYPGLRYTGRLATDPLGTMSQPETILVSGSAASGSNRYGDYAAMCVDPLGGCMYWFTGMYNASSTWSTRIGAFSFDTCGCTPPPAPAGVSAIAGAANQVVVSWSPAAGAGSYNVYRSPGACPGSAFALVTNIVATTFTNAGLSGGSVYAFVVRSYVATSACESTNSACAQATAAGACTTPPAFAGVASVSNLQRATCGLLLTWAPATLACSTAATYNVYRSTAASFTPSAANRIASCLGGTFYEDATPASGATNYYIVRAEDPGLPGAGPCIAGTEDTNTVVRSGIASGLAAVGFQDVFEAGTSKWVEAYVTTSAGTAWAPTNIAYHSASTSLFCAAQASVKDRVIATALPVPVTVGAVLEFWHYLDQESGYDGGVLEYSTNNATWTDILAANGSLPANTNRFLAGGYGATISSSYASPIAGRRAWSGTIGAAAGFSRVAVSLADFTGASIYLRWRLACDSSVSASGWWIDDVSVSASSPCAPGGYAAWRTNFVWTVGTGQPNEDANGDGISNFESYFYGLNPTSPPSGPAAAMPAIGATSNGVRFAFTPDTNAAMAASYRVEQTPSVVTGAWTTVLPTPTQGAAGQVVLPLPGGATSLFLRVKMTE